MPVVGDAVPLAFAFGAGLVATVNPCGFALLPSFVSYYLGSGVSGDEGPGRVAEGLVVGLVLTAGFMLVFGSVGLLFGLGARAVVRIMPWVTMVMGLGLMALGGWLLAGKHLALRLPGLRAPEGPGYRSMFAFGMAYAVGSLSCTLPVFLVVMGSGLAAGSALGTLGVFLAYGLGMSTILMVLCLGTAGFREFVVRRTRRLMPYMSQISGGLLLLSGGYVAYYWFSLLSGQEESGPVRFMQALQRGAQNLVLQLSDRLWFAVGIALLATALLSLVARRVRRQRISDEEIADDEEMADESPEMSEEGWRA